MVKNTPATLPTTGKEDTFRQMVGHIQQVREAVFARVNTVLIDLYWQPITRVWQKWRFSAQQTHLWLIKVLFSASTFVVKIATFAKPENVIGYSMTDSTKQ